jgi:hypothetical protein
VNFDASSPSTRESRRNVAIVLATAAAVYFIPGGGDAADLVGAVLSVAILASIVMIFVRLYRENRVEIHALGERHRAILYGALGLAVLAMASIGRLFESDAGILAWFAMMALVSWGFVAVWRHYRSYQM